MLEGFGKSIEASFKDRAVALEEVNYVYTSLISCLMLKSNCPCGSTASANSTIRISKTSN